MTRSALSPGTARLTAALRELKDRVGLSLAGLAAATTFSKSSWERYLNGRTLPPRGAVTELCRLAGEPDGHCLALWDIAEAEWGGRSESAVRPSSPSAGVSADTSPAPPLTSEPPARSVVDSKAITAGGRPWTVAVAVLTSVCAAVLAIVVLALLLLPDRADTPRPSTHPPATDPLCRAATCAGKDPMAMRCAAAPDTLTEHRTATGASVQLRYNRVCGTSWARMWGARIGDRIEMTTDGPDAAHRRGARVSSRSEADTYVYTLMSLTPPGAAVRACFLPVKGGGTECFEARTSQGTPAP